MKETIVVKEDGQRLDIYLADIFKSYSRSQISKSIKDKRVLVNGMKTKPGYIVSRGDEICIDSFREEINIVAKKMDLDIVYEDSSIIVLNKPKGMLVHPGVGDTRESLVNGLVYYTDRLSNLDGDFRPGIVHRLDKDTSGLLVIAKDNESHRFLKKQLMKREMKREYLALVDGIMEEASGVIDKPIGRDPKNRLRMCVIDRNSKEALTNFIVLDRFDSYSYVKASLYTGRMHQIRVHMSYIGHPIVGDMVYGKKTNEFNVKNQLLHSYKIGFIHPKTREYMEIENHSSLDMDRVLSELKDRRI